jgi:hypothetical protein
MQVLINDLGTLLFFAAFGVGMLIILSVVWCVTKLWELIWGKEKEPQA